ncbi:DEAD/DEAH box helicase [Pseudomonas aegrilactucae]|uniref:DEAD/DEAH box helicase n=1 Tax=Pseudomonas aegrilactucae TaxID=2854028 RepID=A0A9Q2XJC4_9PSED|nr:DEAD/DEAH box helicase [Pseudomonas aegrilactucae]MBV6287410.1 DEAD/DEAH box helicase [Pseudomonas aegrilactucae]
MLTTLQRALGNDFWLDQFGPRVLARGSSYEDEKRITLVSVDAEGATTICRGSGGNVYRQTLRVTDDAYPRLIAKCSCPVKTDCKHCAAALYHLMAWFTDNPSLPQMPESHTVSPPYEDQIIENVPARPHLTLGSYEFSAYMPKTGKMQRQLQHRAALAFTYDGLRTSARSNSEIIRIDGRIRQRIQRQPDAEATLRQTLKKMGFSVATRQSKALPDTAGEMLQMADDQTWLEFARQGIGALRDAGWEVEIKPDFAFNLHDIDHWYADVEEAPGREWFDLELGIVVNGQRHSLLPIVLHLLRSNPELLRASELARRGDDEHLLIDLNRARHDSPALRVALPYARIKPLMATLGELYLGNDSGPSLRLAAPDAARLSSIDDMAMTWRGGDRVRDFARRLRESNRVDVAAPEGLNATLRPYQLEGLNWLQTLRELEVGGILGDDMGLGKTLQTLAHLLTEKNAGRLQRPALAVMPTSLIPNWLDEAQHFTPQLRVLALHGAGRSKHFGDIDQYDLVLTTYALLPRDLAHFTARPWHLLILDEAQNIKNATSKAAEAAREIQAGQRLCLTGTPMENNLGELWSIFHFLLPGWLGDSKRFSRDYRTPIERHGDAERMAHLAARVRPFLLRRTKEQVARELPAKTEIVHWVELSDAQRDTYETVRVAMDKKVREEITRNGAARSQIVILDALLKLRQVCCDLRLVKSMTPRTTHSEKGKLASLMQMLDELLSEGRRILLFSQFTSMLELIEQELHKRGVSYSLLTGETRDRRTPVQQFQSRQTPLFLISLKAGGTGLNLTAADTVIHYDPWWNPATENQATDRAYRIGQDKPVFVYKLITRGTVEEKIQKLQQEKAALAAGLLDGRHAGDWKLADEDIDALFAPLPGRRQATKSS